MSSKEIATRPIAERFDHLFKLIGSQIADHQVGELATFDLMFEGIRTALKSGVQRAVNVAEKNLDNKFAVQVLKALLLVKYVKEFKATVRNLTVLMLPHFEAEQEVFNFVNGNQRNGLRSTMQTLVQRFERKPYGWYLAAVQCIVAKLCGRGKLEVRQDGTLLEDAALARAIGHTHGYGNIVLTPQVEFSAARIRGLRDFYAEFFDGPPHANEAKALRQETAEAFRELGRTLAALRQQAVRYPFLTALDEPGQRVQAVSGQPYPFYLVELWQQEDDLLALKEEVIEPVRRFMGGAQKEIYVEVTHLRTGSPEKSFIHLHVSEDCHSYNINCVSPAMMKRVLFCRARRLILAMGIVSEGGDK